MEDKVNEEKLKVKNLNDSNVIAQKEIEKLNQIIKEKESGS